MTEHAAPYVTNHAWLRQLSRADTIDEIADSVERRPEQRPTVPGEIPSLRGEPQTRWPRRSRGWRSLPRLHPALAREAV